MERDRRVIDGRLLFRIRRLATTRDITISELLSQSLDALEQVDELRLEVASLARGRSWTASLYRPRVARGSRQVTRTFRAEFDGGVGCSLPFLSFLQKLEPFRRLKGEVSPALRPP